jgi:hypothetical protein
MAFTGNFMCTSFKVELMQGVHNFTNGTGNTFKLALYDNSASFTAATTAYTSSNEVANSGTYSAGGGTLTNVTPTSSGTTAFTDFADLSFTSATITAYGAMIYNDSAAAILLYVSWILVVLRPLPLVRLRLFSQPLLLQTLLSASLKDKTVWLMYQSL